MPNSHPTQKNEPLKTQAGRNAHAEEGQHDSHPEQTGDRSAARIDARAAGSDDREDRGESEPDPQGGCC